MTEKEVGRYIELVDRRLFILLHSGVDWKPEYGPELERINQELGGLRKLIEAEHAERKEKRKHGMWKSESNYSGNDSIVSES